MECLSAGNGFPNWVSLRMVIPGALEKTGDVFAVSCKTITGNSFLKDGAQLKQKGKCESICKFHLNLRSKSS